MSFEIVSDELFAGSRRSVCAVMVPPSALSMEGAENISSSFNQEESDAELPLMIKSTNPCFNNSGPHLMVTPSLETKCCPVS